MLLWADNCSLHKTEIVDTIYDELKIDTWLPPNMTAFLQPCDLVINGPIKTHIRRLRAIRIVAAFKVFRSDYENAVALKLQLPHWKLPKPQMKTSILDIIELFRKEFATENFRTGIVRSFEKSGLIPATVQSNNSAGNIANSKFLEFKDESCGYMTTVIPAGTISQNPINIDSDVFLTIDDDCDVQDSETQRLLTENSLTIVLDGDSESDSESDSDSDTDSIS